MIYAGIDVNIITHEKAEAAGPEAFGLWCWGMCWAQVHESDGRLPRILVLRALSGRRNVMLAKRLVDVGLWLAGDDGSWTIANYAAKNQTREQIQAKKDAARQRKEDWKARQDAKRNANGTRSSDATERVPERPLPPAPSLQTKTPPSPSPESLGPEPSSGTDVEPVPGLTEKASTLRYREAYREGIAKGKGSPFAWPPGPKADDWADKDLGHVITVFARSRSTGKAIRGPDLLLWIAAAAEDFSSAVAEGVRTATDDPKYWSNYAPKGLLRFLNQDTQSEEARNVG